MTIGEEALGIVAEAHEGRPTKIDGNSEHPTVNGVSNTIIGFYSYLMGRWNEPMTWS